VAARIATLGIRDLHVRIGAQELLKGISLDLYPGDAMALVGPNGAGKTTLLETCVGLKIPSAGRVSACGLDPSSQRDQLRARVGMYLQPSLLPNTMTVREAAGLFRAFYDASDIDVDEALSCMGLLGHGDKRCGVLSAGERQRLLIALSLLGSPSLLLMDEPASALDADSRQAFHALLPALRERGIAILVATHQTDGMEKYFNRYCVMAAGRIVHSGEIGQLVELNREWPIDVSVTVEPARDLRSALGAFAGLRLVGQREGTIQLRAREATTAIADIAELCTGEGVGVSSLWMRDSTKPGAMRQIPSPPGK
jgi:ABC-2 type transport system ATP-binding protein